MKFDGHVARAEMAAMTGNVWIGKRLSASMFKILSSVGRFSDEVAAELYIAGIIGDVLGERHQIIDRAPKAALCLQLWQRVVR